MSPIHEVGDRASRRWKSPYDNAIFAATIIASRATNPEVEVVRDRAAATARRLLLVLALPVYGSNVGLHACRAGILPLDEPGANHDGSQFQPKHLELRANLDCAIIILNVY
jgi:hypothetical protein